MNISTRNVITVQAEIDLPVDKVWDLWTIPWHIIHWYQASDDWHTARAENIVKRYGTFLFRMEARDGSFGFDFSGEYRKVVKNNIIECVLADGRKVSILFKEEKNGTLITESFEPEETHSHEMQKDGWQAILNSFKKYAEASEDTEIMHFETIINSSVEKVYETMLREDSYRVWTAIFNSDSHYSGSWEKGSRMLFLGTDSKGGSSGMVSWIKDNIKNRLLSIEHIGIVKNGKEYLCGKEVEGWKGSLENYTFRSLDNRTLLSIDIDSNHDFKSYFEETWPKALDKLRSVCELEK